MTDGTATLWWASLDDFGREMEAIEARLPIDERQRAERFGVVVARHRFVLGRTLLRRALGVILDVDAQTLLFSTRRRGKPYLVAPETTARLEFNLSHSRNVVALAVAPTEIGIDVEGLRVVTRAVRLARRFFSAAEQSAVLEVEGAARDRVFLRIWTRKEAYLKATGLGVGMPLRQVETEPDPAEPPRMLAIAGDRDEADRWALTEVEIPDAVCTVAMRRPAPDLDVRRITPAELDLG